MNNPFGQERNITTPDGRTWTLGRLKLPLVRLFGQWVEKQEGDPFFVTERYLGRISEERLMPFFKEAKDTFEQLKAFSLTVPVAVKHIKREEGMAELYRLLLSQHHPNVSLDDAFAVALADNVTLEEAIQIAEGVPPKNADAPAAE